MGNDTRDHPIAIAGVVAGVLPALSGLVGLTTLTGWYPATGVQATAAVVAAVAAVVVGLAGRRRADRATLAFAVAVVLLALAWVPVPPALWPLTTILRVASKGLLLAFGVLVVQRSSGLTRLAGWLVAGGAVVWLLGGVVVWFGVVPDASQELLGALFLVGPVGMFVGFLAAALLFAGPLLRPVGRGARYLWSTADVR